jgi:hypothetical protein
MQQQHAATKGECPMQKTIIGVFVAGLFIAGTAQATWVWRGYHRHHGHPK